MPKCHGTKVTDVFIVKKSKLKVTVANSGSPTLEEFSLKSISPHEFPYIW